MMSTCPIYDSQIILHYSPKMLMISRECYKTADASLSVGLRMSMSKTNVLVNVSSLIRGLYIYSLEII